MNDSSRRNSKYNLRYCCGDDVGVFRDCYFISGTLGEVMDSALFLLIPLEVDGPTLTKVEVSKIES